MAWQLVTQHGMASAGGPSPIWVTRLRVLGSRFRVSERRTPSTDTRIPGLIGGGPCWAREGSDTMPMVDVYAPAGAFEDKHLLVRRLAAAVILIEEVPDIAM